MTAADTGPTPLTNPAPEGKLAGRVAFVTGGTRGIGAAICRSLAADAARYITGQVREVNGGLDM